MASMLSLVDVLPKHERTDIGTCSECNGTGKVTANGNGSGKECSVCSGSGRFALDVFGVSGEDIGKILMRYPKAFENLAQSGGKPTGLDPGLLGAIIAATQRDPADPDTSLLGNEKVEKRARSMAVGAQMKMLQAMGRCTFPDGIGPFLEGLVSTSSAAKEAMDVVVQVVSKAQGTASPPTPKPSEQPDIQASGS